MKAKNYGPTAPPAWFLEFNPQPVTDNRGYNHMIDTKAGALRVTFYETWIATRFDNAKEAAQWVDADDYNGKWNFLGENREHTMHHYLSILKP